jgi:ribonuclease T1
VVVAALAAVIWWIQAGSDGDTSADDPEPSRTTATSSSGAATDDVSGLPSVALADLPPEAADVVALIDQGGPFPYSQDGSTFGNFEGLLPDREDGYYREYTVETPGSDDRGARRIVGGAEGELYWTEDHYESFEVIRR